MDKPTARWRIEHGPQDADVQSRPGEQQQRLHQVRNTIHSLTRRVEAEEKIKHAARREYVTLANIHQFEDLRPIGDAPIPRRDEEQLAEARRNQTGATTAIILGCAVAAILGALSINGPVVAVAAGSAALAFGFAHVFVRLLAEVTGARPRNPGAARTVKTWLYVFGVLLVLSFALFGWSRFVEDDTLVSFLLSASLVGFELGIFGVGAALKSVSYIYGWTDDLTTKYELAATEADKLRVKLGENQLELDEELHKIEQTTTANAAAKTAQEREEVELKGIRQ